jgi:hypothetical protein
MKPNRAARAARLVLCASIALGAAALPAQTMDDTPFIPRRAIGVGIDYSIDSWSRYWEGTLERTNANIGRMTTRDVAFVVGYGVSDRLEVTAMLPYVRTRATQGTLHEMSGVQDFSVTARYKLLVTPFTDRARLGITLVGGAGVPATDYTPDFQPLSIGSASRRATGRVVLNLQSNTPLFATMSSGYTWRRNVRLDRTSYYTQGQLYLTNEVEMPDVVDYTGTVGWRAGALCVPLVLTQQLTRGGGDIRRQDMPFVSNRMDFVKFGGSIMYTLPTPQPLALHVGTMRTLSGRNVGNSETYTAGLMYTIQR